MPQTPHRFQRDRRRPDPRALTNPGLGVAYFAIIKATDDHAITVSFSVQTTALGLPDNWTCDGSAIVAITPIDDRTFELETQDATSPGQIVDIAPNDNVIFGPNVVAARAVLSLVDAP